MTTLLVSKQWGLSFVVRTYVARVRSRVDPQRPEHPKNPTSARKHRTLLQCSLQTSFGCVFGLVLWYALGGKGCQRFHVRIVSFVPLLVLAAAPPGRGMGISKMTVVHFEDGTTSDEENAGT